MRILHVVAGLPRGGGGLSELVPAFAGEAARQGHEVVLATVAAASDALSDKAREAEAAGVRLVRFEPSFPLRLYFSAAMWRGLRRLVEQAEVVHVHSDWTFPVWRACHLALALNKPLVMSPQGCLEPVRLARSAWKKRAAGALFDRRYLRRAAVVHATCEAEADGIRAYVGGAAGPRVAVVPNGVDGGLFSGRRDRDRFEARWPECRSQKVVLSLSRLNPLKGLDHLLVAWSRLAGGRQPWRLLIAGPDEGGYEARLKASAESLGIASSVTFCGPLYGQDKALALQNASLFVLPTLNENFGIAVAEALACGVPVITTRGAPWEELLGNEERASGKRLAVSRMPFSEHGEEVDGLRLTDITASGRCGWWVDIGAAPLAEALGEAMSLSEEERLALGENGRRLAAEKYRWETVAERMRAVYSGMVNSKT